MELCLTLMGLPGWPKAYSLIEFSATFLPSARSVHFGINSLEFILS